MTRAPAVRAAAPAMELRELVSEHTPGLGLGAQGLPEKPVARNIMG